MKTQLSTFVISANFKIWQFLNKEVMWTLKGPKFIMLSAFFGDQTLFVEEILEVPKLYLHNLNINGK